MEKMVLKPTETVAEVYYDLNKLLLSRRTLSLIKQLYADSEMVNKKNSFERIHNALDCYKALHDNALDLCKGFNRGVVSSALHWYKEGVFALAGAKPEDSFLANCALSWITESWFVSTAQLPEIQSVLMQEQMRQIPVPEVCVTIDLAEALHRRGIKDTELQLHFVLGNNAAAAKTFQPYQLERYIAQHSYMDGFIRHMRFAPEVAKKIIDAVRDSLKRGDEDVICTA